MLLAFILWSEIVMVLSYSKRTSTNPTTKTTRKLLEAVGQRGESNTDQQLSARMYQNRDIQEENQLISDELHYQRYRDRIFDCRSAVTICRENTVCDVFTGTCRELYLEDDEK